MTDDRAREIYAKAGLGASVTLGARPAVLVVDFSCGFTDPACALSPDHGLLTNATKDAGKAGADFVYRGYAAAIPVEA